MTKYVVQSGGLVRFPDKARKYYKEVFSSFKDSDKEIKMLWCFFASADYGEDNLLKKWLELLGGFLPTDCSIHHTATSVENFAQQVAEADVVYFHGGSTDVFLSRVNELDIENQIADKVVCTNSAATLAFSSAGWDSDTREVIKGLAILPIKTMVHFNSNYGADDPRGFLNWGAAKKELEEYGNISLPVHALEEGEFIVVTQ
jgi:peptidase E